MFWIYLSKHSIITFGPLSLENSYQSPESMFSKKDFILIISILEVSYLIFIILCSIIPIGHTWTEKKMKFLWIFYHLFYSFSNPIKFGNVYVLNEIYIYLVIQLFLYRDARLFQEFLGIYQNPKELFCINQDIF